MPDQFTEKITTGYGNRILNSIGGVLIGLVLFIGSFVLLYWNEGRADISSIAKTAVEVSSQSVSTDTSLTNKLISTTGVVNSDQTIGDNLFLNQDKYIAIQRKVEMYAWIEEKQTKTTKNTGGSETTETTYNYVKGWTGNPGYPSDFKYPQGHENPTEAINDSLIKVQSAAVGAYSFDPGSVTLPESPKLSLDSQNINLSQNAVLANDTYLFVPKSATGTYENPGLGDLRVSYTALKTGFTGTIFGNLSSDGTIVSYDQNNNHLYRLFTGTRDAAISTMHSEFVTLTWILRLLGFLAMWIGLMAVFGPVSVLLDILPVFGTISRTLVGFLTFIVSLVLSIVTIIVSMLLHSLVALLIALLITIGVIYLLTMRWKNKKKAQITPVPPTPPTPPVSPAPPVPPPTPTQV